jgi:hypothetical protein
MTPAPIKPNITAGGILLVLAIPDTPVPDATRAG